MLMLAMHKDVQQKVYEEQLEVMRSEDPTMPIQPIHLVNMKYLHMVIQEVLRIFPIAPTLLRKLSGDFKIGKIVIVAYIIIIKMQISGDMTVPKDATILVNVYSVHMNEKIWPDPKKFDPLRFTKEEKAKRHPHSYLPFSGGIRACIGTVSRIKI
jgi:cytochrome P450